MIEGRLRRKWLLRYAAVFLSIVTILSLDLILLLGAVVHDSPSARPILDGLVAILDLSLVSSSVLLGRFFLKQRNRFLGSVFLLNIGIFALAFILRVSGVLFPPWLLYTMDIYWLNVYLICLTGQFPSLISAGSR